MNITPFDVYLVMQLDSFNFFCGSIAVASLLVAILIFWAWIDAEANDLSEDKSAIKIFKVGKTASVVFFIFSIAFMALPSTKTAASMLLLPAIANNKEVQQLPEDLLKMVRGLVKEWTPKEDVKKEGK